MANRAVFTAIAGLAWALGLALVAAHQPSTSGSQQKAPSRQRGGEEMRSKDDMMSLMQECRQTQQEAMSAVDRMTAKIEAAKQANDASQIRAALDQVQQPLAEMKDGMAVCMNAMDSMQAMHRAMGGRMQGMMQSWSSSTQEGISSSRRTQ
jgi:hypothetical protein